MKKSTTGLALVTLLAASTSALAHVGQDAGMHHGLAAGLLHPFTGLDHLAAMLSVGVWSAGSAQRRWLAPLMFAAMLLAGALLARAGLQLPGIEAMIACSLLAVGALLMLPRQAPVAVGALMLGGFALFHGAAHGQELSGNAALAGMLLGTLALHGLGIALGLGLRRQSLWLPRIAGAAVALLGLGLLA